MISTHARQTIENSRSKMSHHYLIIGSLTCLVLATVALVTLAFAAHNTPYFPVDLEIARAVQSFQAKWFGLLLHAISWPGFPPQVNIWFALILIWLYVDYSRWTALSFAFAALGSAPTQYIIKVLVDRPRPSPELIHVVDPSLISGGLGLSFPAGHPASYVALFGFLGYLVYTSQKRSIWRTLFLLSIGTMIVAVGFGRVYEGEHWFSDVIAGYLLGIIWLILAIYFYEWGKGRFLTKLSPTGLLAYPRPEGLLARIPVIGFGLFLLGSLLFGVLALNVSTNGPLLAWDVPVAQALHLRATHDFWLTLKAMIFSGSLGREIAQGISILFGVYWLSKHRWHEFSMLLMGVGGGAIWFRVLSHFFARPRPVFPDPLEQITSPGFPSGHSMTAMLLFGLILYLLLPRLPSWRWRLLAVLDAVLIALLIGYSRLYMGSHYPTDVLGGYAFGLAWGALVYTGLELYHRHRSVPRRGVPG